MDEVKERGGLKNPDGINQYSEVMGSTEPKLDIERSATTTARKAGTSATKEQREKCWHEMRADGKTLAAIAEADGTVSAQTVMRAIDEPAFPNGKAEIPTKVVGKDGKKYPTKYTKSLPKPDHIYIHDNDVEKALLMPG